MSQKDNILQTIKDTEANLDKTRKYIDILNSELKYLEVGSFEYTSLMENVLDLQWKYITQVYRLAISKAKLGIVGNSWYK